MKVLVPIKRVIDPYVKIQILPNHQGVDTQHAKMGLNPFDEIALEEAIRWREAGLIQEVVVVSIGQLVCQETLRLGLALGADRGIHVETDVEASALLESIHIARILAQLVSELSPQIVILGKQAIDDDCNQTGQMLAGLLGWPQATFASKIVLNADVSSATVTREVDAGLERLKISLPAVMTTDLRLNEPRYATLPNIMKAKQKPIEKRVLSDFKIDLTSYFKILQVDPPRKREAGVQVESVEALLQILRKKEQVLE